jgi:hypothetical protein
MLTLLILAGGYAGWRIAAAALASVRDLPRSNDDMIFY